MNSSKELIERTYFIRAFEILSNRNMDNLTWPEKEKIFGLKRNSILRIIANEFITVMLTAISSIQTENDFADMVFECAREMVEQNIIYREAMFDYTACYGRRGIPLKTVMNGFAKGLKLAKQKFNNIDICFIANLDRTAQVKDNCKYIQELVKYRDMISLIAVGMDMQELGHPAHRQAEAFAVAKENGFFITGHVGEEVGPEGIWDAIQSIPFDRIDHGVRAVEDEKLLEWLADKKILLTLCPASNISLEVYPSWDKYPIKKLIDNEVKVCINSDDPPCFHYDLTGNIIKILGAGPDGLNSILYLVRGQKLILVARIFRQIYKFNPCNCFSPGTLVNNQEGAKPIEQVQVGDMVWSNNPDTGISI
ncbi:hypothetical protein NYE59_20330 [Paenibacillus sp. FSL L8-0323]|uniref:adenosine deaminase family protein n=1 Tax=Paenibacillus TaxID=44249 RepID=UPI00117C3DE8|nr:hypothetical protein [Paenibacillus odorifer]